MIKKHKNQIAKRISSRSSHVAW